MYYINKAIVSIVGHKAMVHEHNHVFIAFVFLLKVRQVGETTVHLMIEV